MNEPDSSGFMPTESELRKLRSAKTLKILIVEDDTNGMAVMLASKLKVLREHFDNPEIIIVGTLADGLRRAYEDPAPDVTFLDLGMPDSDWEDTARRAEEIEDRCPVIIVTGHYEQAVRPLVPNRDIEILHKDIALWDKIIPAIARALPRSLGKSKSIANDDAIRQNIETLRKMIQNGPSQ